MARNADALHRAAQEIEAEGLNNADSSRFVEAILRTMPESPSVNQKAQVVASGLEHLLARHHDDSKRIISASVALGEASEYEMPIFVKKLGRFMRFLDHPVASHSLKNIKLADFVSKNPELLKAKEVDAISVLGRLPAGSFAMGAGKDEIWVGSMSVNVEKDDMKKVNQVVKKYKAEIKAKEKAEEVEIDIPRVQVPEEPELPPRKIEGASAYENPADDDDDSEEGETAYVPERENDLPEELSQAERALSKVLGRLSSSEIANPELSQALEEARRYLRMALRQDQHASSEAFA